MVVYKVVLPLIYKRLQENLEIISFSAFFRINRNPDREGWAPSTYLQIIPGNTKTLDRK